MRDMLRKYNALRVKRDRLKTEWESLKRDNQVHDFVTGSRADRPYDKRTFHIHGVAPAARGPVKKEYVEYLECCEEVNAIEEAIHGICDVEIKEAVIGHYVYRKSWAEVAHELRLTEAAIKKRVYRYVEST